MIISIRLSDLDGTLLKKFALCRNETVSAYVRRVVFSDIEQEYYRVMDEIEGSLSTEVNDLVFDSGK